VDLGEFLGTREFAKASKRRQDTPSQPTQLTNPPNYAYSKHPCLPGHGQRFTVCGPPVFSRVRHSARMALVSHRRLYRPPRMTGAKLSNSKGQRPLKRGFNLPRCKNIVSPTACSGHAACARCWTRANPTSWKRPFIWRLTVNRRVILSPRVRRTSADTLVRCHVPLALSVFFIRCYKAPLEKCYDKPGPVRCYVRRGTFFYMRMQSHI
jgi:hypothetical protein